MTDTLILVCGYGYEPDKLRVLLCTARQHCPQTRIVLFFHRKDEHAVQLLSAWNPMVEVVIPRDHRARQILWRIRGKTMFVRTMAAAMKSFHLLPGADAYATRLAAVFHVSLARYFYARQYLRSCAEGVKFVMLCDGRDVLLQADPFKELRAGELWTGAEDRAIGDCGINSRWIREVYGETVLCDMARETIFCSGVNIGSRERIATYLDAMCAEMAELLPKIAFSGAYDQPIHNRLVRQGAVGEVSFSANGDSLIATLEHSDMSAFCVTEDGLLLTRDGERVRIVHQYDRKPGLAQSHE